ncbi:MAG: hypothetical protein ACXVXI_10665 [Mycobacteriaceae bacterium]
MLETSTRAFASAAWLTRRSLRAAGALVSDGVRGALAVLGLGIGALIVAWIDGQVAVERGSSLTTAHA